MTGLLAILALGFVLGMRHATDPDHVIAVTTIVARHRSAKAAAVIGAVWGLGHTLTILVVGGGIILYRWVIPQRLGLSMELAVGLMLIVLGIANLKSVLWLFDRNRFEHSHAHAHGDYIHTHPHRHTPEVHPHAPDQTPLGWLDRSLAAVAVYQLARPLLVGVVHGLAGSAAVALLVVPAIGNPRWSILYLLVFGGGTMVGMALITAVISMPFAFGDRVSIRFAGGLRLASGLISVAFGCLLIYRIGVVQGLFAAPLQ
ncbi:MAG: high-affinity nickel-transport family protein [Gemmatimonadales bacterium]